MRGIQLPIGGFRGSGLAWMVDILSGVITGGNHVQKVKDPFEDFSGPQNIGHLFIHWQIYFKKIILRIKDNIKTIKNLPKIKVQKKLCILVKISLKDLEKTLIKKLKFLML